MNDVQKLIDGLSGFTPPSWTVDPKPGATGKYDIWTECGELICENASDADAALIAAAPELINAVVVLLADRAELLDALEIICAFSSGYAPSAPATIMRQNARAALEETK